MRNSKAKIKTRLWKLWFRCSLGETFFLFQYTGNYVSVLSVVQERPRWLIESMQRQAGCVFGKVGNLGEQDVGVCEPIKLREWENGD